MWLEMGLLLLSTQISYLQGGCPLRCNCTENSVLCISANLELVPYFESLSNNPVIIDLSGNEIQIVDIDDFSFDKSDQVKEIYLNNSGLVEIEERALEELESLQELYLAENFLISLPELFIEKNEFMILLDISRNHFVEMPKIKSESLEVLAIANSRVSNIPNDALDGLPNLRTLLLQQNNLKSVDPIVFKNTPQFFFVSTAYNPWHCSCKTVKFFNYLTEHGYRDTKEKVQCRTQNREYIEIYDEQGITDTFKEICNDQSIFTTDNKTKDSKYVDLMTLLKSSEPSDDDNDDYFENEVDYVPINDTETQIKFSVLDFFYACVLAISTFLSLIIGAIIGSYITYRRMSFHIRSSESTKQLIEQRI